MRQTKKNAAQGARAESEQDWRSIPAATATSGWRAKLGKRAVPLTYAWPSCSRALRNPVSFKSRTSLLESAFWSCAEAQRRRSAEAEEGGNRKKSKVAPWSLDRSQPRCQHTDGRRPHARQRVLVRRQVNGRLRGARLRGKELLRPEQLARGGRLQNSRQNSCRASGREGQHSGTSSGGPDRNLLCRAASTPWLQRDATATLAYTRARWPLPR